MTRDATPRATPERKRLKRLTFDVDQNTFETIDAIAKQQSISVRALCLEAIRQFIDPPFRFFAPRAPDREPLAPFLKEAHELLMIGLTLASLHQEEGLEQLLTQRIAEARVPMTFIMLHPDSAPGDPSYDVIEQRVFRGELNEHLRATKHVLARLSQRGREAHVPVRVMGLKSIPMVGATIVDPLTAWCRMRIALYLHTYPNESYPFFEISAKQPQGAQACNAFIRHYQRLVEEAQVIEDFSAAEGAA